MTHSVTETSRVAAFRALHQSGCFVMPNPWDVGSALYLGQLGFPALATTSAGFAFSRGLPDDLRGVSRELMLAHIREIAAATPLPVNADFQDGFGVEPAEVAAGAALCAATGAAGFSIEDATGKPGAPLHERSLAVERIRAARAAIDQSGTGALLTGRCEAFLVGAPDPLAAALDRLPAYAEAGAECLYAPGVRDPDAIAALVRAVAPRPLNVLVGSPGLSVARLADLGVRRISVGSGLALAAWGAFIRAARTLAESGSFEGLAGNASFGELNRLFGGR